MGNTIRRKSNPKYAKEHHAVRLPGGRQQQQPAGDGHTYRINTSAVNLKPKLLRMADGDLLPAYTEDVLAECLLLYRCIRNHPKFVDRQFKHLNDALDYLIEETTRCLGGYDWNLVYSGEATEPWFPDEIHMPVDLSLIGQNKSGVYLEYLYAMELKYLQDKDVLQVNLILMAMVIMYRELGIRFFNQSKEMFPSEREYITEIKEAWGEDDPDVQFIEPVEEMEEQLSKYEQFKNIIRTTPIDAARKTVSRYIKEATLEERVQPLYQWLDHIHFMLSKSFNLQDFGPVFGLTIGENDIPLLDIDKVFLCYNMDWIYMQECNQKMSQQEYDNGQVPLFNNEVLTDRKYYAPKPCWLSVKDALYKLMSFDLKTLSWIERDV